MMVVGKEQRILLQNIKKILPRVIRDEFIGIQGITRRTQVVDYVKIIGRKK